MPGDRGVSSVVSTVLMVGIVVLIAVPAGIYAFQVGQPGSDPAPTVQRSEASMTGSGSSQVVSITHGGGDTIDMENVEIVVRNEGTGDSARIVDIPVSSPSTSLSASNVEGAGIVSTSYDVSGTPLSTASGDGEWTVGEKILFEVTSLAADQTVVVKLVHTETNSVLGEERFNTST